MFDASGATKRLASCHDVRVAQETALSTIDGYTIVDVPEAERLVGPIRTAKKVLQRTTLDLVRHATYACAVHGLNAAGAAAALNHDRASEDQSPIAAFAEELATWAEACSFVGSVGLSIGAEEAGPVLSVSAEMAEASSIASASACAGGGASVIVVSGSEEAALVSALGDVTVEVQDDPKAALQAGVDVVMVRGKTGVLDHEVLADTNAKLVIGLQPLTVTARGLAVASRAGAIVVPDFISAAGPTLAALGNDPTQVREMTTDAVGALTGHGVDLFVAACERAEAHLRTITETLPFGRPLAP